MDLYQCLRNPRISLTQVLLCGLLDDSRFRVIVLRVNYSFCLPTYIILHFPNFCLKILFSIPVLYHCTAHRTCIFYCFQLWARMILYCLVCYHMFPTLVTPYCHFFFPFTFLLCAFIILQRSLKNLTYSCFCIFSVVSFGSLYFPALPFCLSIGCLYAPNQSCLAQIRPRNILTSRIPVILVLHLRQFRACPEKKRHSLIYKIRAFIRPHIQNHRHTV